MRKVIMVISIIIISALQINAQELKEELKESSAVAAAETDLETKYAEKLKALEDDINKIIFNVAMNDPQIVNRLNQLLITVPEYNKKIGYYNAVKELLTELEGEENENKN